MRNTIVCSSLSILLAACAMGACSSSSGRGPSTTDAGSEGGARDASTEDAPTSDGGTDDATNDVATDVATDALPEASPEAGCAGIATDGAAPITVHGTVVSMYTRAPTSVHVTIGGVSTTSASDGTFTVSCVVPPYDVLLEDTVAPEHDAYIGLTRPDPTLGIFADAQGGATASYFQQPLSGNLTLGGSPLDGGTQGDAGVSSGYMAVMNGSTLAGEMSGDTFDLVISPTGAPPLPLTLYGFTFSTLPTGGIAAIQAAGLANVMATGYPLSNEEIPLSPSNVMAGTLSGTLSVPSGATVTTALYVTSSLLQPVAQDTPAGSTFSYGTFQSPLGWTLDVITQNTDGSGCYEYFPGLVGNEKLSVTIPTGSQITAPTQSGTFNPNTTDFAWSHVANTVHTVSMESSSNVRYIVLTEGDSLKFPYPLASDSYLWGVSTTWSVASVDALAQSADTLIVVSPGSNHAVAQTACGNGGTVSF